MVDVDHNSSNAAVNNLMSSRMKLCGGFILSIIKVAHLPRIAAFCSPTTFLILFLAASIKQYCPILGFKNAAWLDERVGLLITESIWQPSIIRKDWKYFPSSYSVILASQTHIVLEEHDLQVLIDAKHRRNPLLWWPLRLPENLRKHCLYHRSLNHNFRSKVGECYFLKQKTQRSTHKEATVVL